MHSPAGSSTVHATTRRGRWGGRARAFLRIRLDRWLFRLEKVEQGEIFLYQRRVFIVPSQAGLAFGALLVVLFIGSINYNLNLGFGLTFLIASCALIDMHLAFRNIAHLALQAGRSQPVFAGEEARFELLLINRYRRDRYAIRVGFVGGGLPDVEQAVDIPGDTTRSVTLAVTAPRRGWLAAPRVRLQTRFPLGLLRAWAYWQPDAVALVYPRPEDQAPPLPAAQQQEPDGRGSAGHDEFAGVRAYQPGDSMKQLAWRQIARLDGAGGTLVTKHFEGGGDGAPCLDLALLPRDMDIERKLSRLTRWVLEAEARGIAYAFRLGATELAPGVGPAQRDACLRALALYEAP